MSWYGDPTQPGSLLAQPPQMNPLALALAQGGTPNPQGPQGPQQYPQGSGAPMPLDLSAQSQSGAPPMQAGTPPMQGGIHPSMAGGIQPGAAAAQAAQAGIGAGGLGQQPSILGYGGGGSWLPFGFGGIGPAGGY
jgi:hypothetical protein